MAQQKGRTSKADATRRQLLDAAIEVISERGYADTTVERIVEVAGVSKGVAYYHFSSKADIATCILVEGIGEIVDDFVAIAGKAPSAVEALTAMMDSFAATIFRNAGFGRILVSELWRRGREWSEPMRALEERLLAVLRGQIERGQREGSIRGDIDAAFEAVAVVGMVLTTTLHYIREAEQRAEEAATAPRRLRRRSARLPCAFATTCTTPTRRGPGLLPSLRRHPRAPPPACAAARNRFFSVSATVALAR